MKGLVRFFLTLALLKAIHAQRETTFKVGRTLSMPLSIRGITPKDLRAIHKEVGDKTWEDIRHLFVIQPTQALLNLLQVPLAKDKLVILPQKGQKDMSLVNVMVEETPLVEMEPVVETTTSRTMEPSNMDEERPTTATQNPMTKCGSLGKTCKISVHPKVEKLGFALCFHYQTGLLGQCIHPETVPSCQPDKVVLCHPFPEMAELFLKNLPTKPENSKARISNAPTYSAHPVLIKSSGEGLSMLDIQNIGRDMERAVAERINDDSQRAIELVQDLYLMGGLEIIPRLVIIVGSNQDDIRGNLQQLHGKQQFISFGILAPTYQRLSPASLKQKVTKDLFPLLLQYLQFKGPQNDLGTQLHFTHELDEVILNFAVLANEGVSFQTRTEVANLFHALELFANVSPEPASWIKELNVPKLCSHGKCQAFTIDPSIQFHFLRTAFSLDCEGCNSKPLRNSKSLIHWINMGIEFKEELFGLVKLVPFWIKASLVNAIRPEYETPFKPTQVSSIESTTMRLVELKSKEAIKYCQLTEADQDLCLNLQTGGIDICPFKVETICRETQIINGFQRFHKVVPGGKLDVPYVPDSPATPTKHVEPRIFGIGSSSSPWFQIGVNLRRECRCLTPQEIYSETKTIVDRPCSQPIPWCYVDYDADCLDKEFQFHPVALWWSQEACRRETSLFSNSYVDFNYYK